MFKSEILSESSAINPAINESNILQDTESYMYNLLKFNDNVHSTLVEDSINTYRLLKEDILREDSNQSLTPVQEAEQKMSITERFRKTILTVLQAIIDFISKIIRSFFMMDIKARNAYKRTATLSHGFVNGDANSKNFVFNLYHYQPIDDMDDQKVRASLNNIISNIDSVCNGEYMPEVSDASLYVAYTALARCVRPRKDGFICDPRKEYDKPVTDRASFMEYVKTDIIYVEKKEMSYAEWRAGVSKILPSSSSDVAKKLTAIKNDFEKCKSKIEKATSIDIDAKNSAMALLGQAKEIVSSYSWYLDETYRIETTNLKYIVNTYNRIKSGGSISESGLIHGEEFNGDTLFANHDMNDFNRTEWMDLTLESEIFQYKYEMDEARKRIAIKEAQIMIDSEPMKIQRLIAMREAELGGAKDKIKAVFDNIKRIVTEFLNKLKQKAGTNTNFMNRNKQFIDRPIKIEKMTSNGDILAGMYRIQQPINIVPFNYAVMKEDLKDKRVFFEKHILNSLQKSSNFAKRNIKWDQQISITDYCKAYYGASVSKEGVQACEFTGQEIEVNKQNIVKFLNRPSILDSVNRDFEKLERESSKVPTTQQQSSTPSNNNNNNNQNQSSNNNSNNQSANNNDNGAKHESYYSELYGTWITEADIEMGKDQNDQQNTNNNATNNANGEEGKKDNDSPSAAFKVYVDAYKDVLMSKLTASEFIINELSQVMKAHAQSYMSADQIKQENEKENKK